jgi:hypothetical protein
MKPRRIPKIAKWWLSAMLILVLTFLASQVLAFDDATKDKIISLALENFWGKARLADGSYVQPENEVDRQTLPVSKETAYQIIEVGKISGLAQWCALDWQKNYLKLTKSARQEGFSEKQVAFIGLLHGVTQGIVENAVKDKKCGGSEKEEAKKLCEKSPNALFRPPH